MTFLIWACFLLFLAFGFVVFFGSPYVPTLRRDRKEAFDDLYTLGPDDMVVDLGSGDGVMLREASRRGAKAFGIELNPLLVALSRFLSRGDSNVTTVLGNLRTTQLPNNTTLVYVFGNSIHTTTISRVIRREATRIGRDISVISYGAQLPDLEVISSRGACTLYKTALYR